MKTLTLIVLCLIGLAAGMLVGKFTSKLAGEFLKTKFGSFYTISFNDYEGKPSEIKIFSKQSREMVELYATAIQVLNDHMRMEIENKANELRKHYEADPKREEKAMKIANEAGFISDEDLMNYEIEKINQGTRSTGWKLHLDSEITE